MKILSVSVKERRRFVPVKGWDSVVNAITLFSNGYAAGSRETQRVTEESVETTTGALGSAFFVLAGIEIGSRSKLADKLLKEAEQALKQRNKFSVSYDYDGMGTPFFKTSVDITKLDEDMFTIGFWAAYVGDQPEEGLAQHLNIPRTLLDCSVVVETQPVAGGRFEFDFEEVLRKLDNVLAVKDTAGWQVIQNLLTEDESGESGKSVVLAEDLGLVVSIRPDRIDNRTASDPSTGKWCDTWKSDNGVLSGNLRRDYNKEDENAKATPTFLISVTSADQLNHGHYKETKPMWCPDEQKRAVALAHEIAAALK
jgi:hypothetical protein